MPSGAAVGAYGLGASELPSVVVVVVVVPLLGCGDIAVRALGGIDVHGDIEGHCWQSSRGPF